MRLAHGASPHAYTSLLLERNPCPPPVQPCPTAISAHPPRRTSPPQAAWDKEHKAVEEAHGLQRILAARKLGPRPELVL